jgi:5'-methylthioinosine phosphorylase
MGLVAIIGGTGLSQIDGFKITETRSVATPYGDPSHHFEIGRYADHPIVFLARHGNPHHIPPHMINYRANLWALKDLGVESIIAVNAVGGIRTDLQLAEVVICDQIIDYTAGREHTFFEDRIEHIDFTFPYDPDLCQQLAAAARQLIASMQEFRFSATGVYGCTQGPRLETAAEIRRLSADGCDVVGMTGMPEASLAAELGIRYSGLSLVINKAAGLDNQSISLDQLQAVLDEGMGRIVELLKIALKTLA